MAEEIEKTTQKTTQKILEIIRENPNATRREIAEKLGDITPDGVKYNLEKLKKEEKIRRIGPDKGGHWEIIQNIKQNSQKIRSKISQ
ncbi:MAG: winged helix-turn-helix transcriptional regulator [Candidatus Moranbacteria bacterium]|nr:winged helix-turn-helix transcriptional regulator [Candidatus Moranbacteria bacterium]